MAALPPPPSTGPSWLGEYTPPPKQVKPEKLPPRSKRNSKELQSSSRRPTFKRKEYVGGINVWAPPHTSPEPEPEPEPVPVSPAINETDPPISNDVGAPGGQCENNQKPVEACTSMDHTPHFDGLRREEGGTPPPAHQEGMEFTTGEHLYRPEQQSTQRIAFQTEVSIEGEAGNDSVLSSEGSAWQCNTDYSPLQEVQTHLQPQPCPELRQQNTSVTSSPRGEQKAEEDLLWQQEHVELKAEFSSLYNLKESPSLSDSLDPWYTDSPRNEPQLLVHHRSFTSHQSVEEVRPRFSSGTTLPQHSTPRAYSEALQSIHASTEELPDIQMAEHSGCPQCGPFWSEELGALYSLLRGVYKDMTILHRAEAEKKESLVEENRLLRAHLSEAVGHAKLLQHELSETASILQTERSLSKCQNEWLEWRKEKDADSSLNASNLCELVEEQAQEILAAQSTMRELSNLLESKLTETPVKQEN